jgi:long-chain fatty acid transport protein
MFPTGFAVYKKENWALSFGFGPNAGGGAADFDRGLPSFEIPITKIVPKLALLTQIDPALNVTGYDADIAFEGRSIFWGIQLGATYKVNNVFSVYGGVRYLPSKTTYQGYIKNIQLGLNNEQYVSAQTWLLGASQTVSEFADLAAAAANMPQTLQPFITGGAGGFTLAQLEGGEYISAAERAGIEQGLEMIGLSQQQIDAMNLTAIHEAYSQASPEFQQQATLLSSKATELSNTASLMDDKKVNTDQTGNAFTPMVGIHISPIENLNIGLKYEMKTALTLKNSPKEGDNYSDILFGESVNSDIPAILSAGLGYNTGLVEAQLSYNMYFNKGVDWGYNTRDLAIWQEDDPSMIRKREIDHNGYEIGLGLQFNVADNFAFSLGGLYGDMGIADSYQSDFSYSNPSFTAGAGIEWKITDALVLDIGASNTFYKDQKVSFSDPYLNNNYSETLGKTTLNFAAGLSYSIF